MVVKHGVSTDSADRLLIDAGAIYFNFIDADSPGTLLGATRGGNSFELARTIRRMEADGAKGPVKGLRRIEEVVATIKANMLELTAENLRRAIAGAIYISGTTPITDEDVGTGDGVTKVFSLAQSPVEENSETIAVVDRGTQVLLTDYTMDYAAGKIYFVTAPEDTKAITATYKYISAAAVMGGETTEANKYLIKDAAYIGNVAIVGTLTGKTNPVIIIITNALCDAGFSLALAPKDEAVPEVTFTAHYVNTDLDTEPWSIEYPAS